MKHALGMLGALAALAPALWMWGFTVDDALISLRYAHHVAAGAGYRFNALGPATDGVTPLPWPWLARPATAGGDLMVGLVRVKLASIGIWTLAAAMLGREVSERAEGDRRALVFAVLGLLTLGLAFPVGAWAASGMETGLATALATFAAVLFARPLRTAMLAGLAATLRPELAPWALVLATGAAISASESARRSRNVAVAAVLAIAPFAVCALVRLVVFGRAAPLAVLAKPSDAAHGFTYAGAAVLVVLTPVLVLAPLALRRASSLAKTLVAAALAHVLVVIAVGGDWMPYGRLVVPIAPSLLLAFVDLSRVSHLAASFVRVGAALLLGTWLFVKASPAGRGVGVDRQELVAKARPLLATSRVVAALDVGWVGAATEATIIDLAGLTDPAIAALPGGHTSKSVDTAMLLDRGVDTVIVFGDARHVERRLVGSALFHDKFVDAGTLAFGTRGQSYRVYRRR